MLGDNIHPARILYLLLNLEENKVLTSSSITLLNSLSFLYKIVMYLLHSSAIFANKTLQNRQLSSCKISQKMC